MEALKKLSDRGFYTSYWVPHFKYDEMSLYTQFRLALDMGYKASKYKISAFSCHYKKYSYLNKFFKLANIHIWTNGITQSEQTILKKDYQNENLKVILTDNDTPLYQ